MRVQKAPKPKRVKDGQVAKPKAAQQATLAACTGSPLAGVRATAGKTRKLQATVVPETSAASAPAPAVAPVVPSTTPATAAEPNPPKEAAAVEGPETEAEQGIPQEETAKDTCDESMSLGESDSDGSEESDSKMDQGGPVEPAPPGSSIAFLAAQAGQQAAGLGDT